jgi:hypothetical protein
MMADLFERLDRGRPAPTEKKTNQKPPAELLLSWLEKWNKDFVSARDIRVFGPKSIRNQKDAVATARILVRNGQLIPIYSGSRKPYLHKWRIVR